MWDSEQVLTHSKCLIGVGIVCIDYRFVLMDHFIGFTNSIHSFPYHYFTFSTLQLPSLSHIHYPLPYLNI
jgi:hypothetical protein